MALLSVKCAIHILGSKAVNKPMITLLLVNNWVYIRAHHGPDRVKDN